MMSFQFIVYKDVIVVTVVYYMLTLSSLNLCGGSFAYPENSLQLSRPIESPYLNRPAHIHCLPG